MLQNTKNKGKVAIVRSVSLLLTNLSNAYPAARAARATNDRLMKTNINTGQTENVELHTKCSHQ